MRILFVLPYVPSLIRVRPFQFIRALAVRHEVTVLAEATTREVEDVARLRELGVSVEAIPLGTGESLWNCGTAALRGEPLQAAICRSREARLRLIRMLESYQPDVVHIEHFRAAYLRSAIPTSVPTLFDSVDCISLLQERTTRQSHSWRQRLLARVELNRTRSYEGRILTQFEQVIVTSAEDRESLLELAPTATIEVVPNGVDLEHFQPMDSPRSPETLIFSGKMSYHANVTAILHFVRHIFPLVRREHPHVRLIVAGSSPPTAVADLSRDPGITVTGYLPDLRPTLATATVAICPVTVKVGIQNKILEAMAMGTPVVASREGATGLAALPERDFLMGDDAAGFAGQINRLLADSALRQRVGKAGRGYVETNHQWAASASALDTLYRQLLDNSPRANSTFR